MRTWTVDILVVCVCWVNKAINCERTARCVNYWSFEWCVVIQKYEKFSQRANCFENKLPDQEVHNCTLHRCSSVVNRCSLVIINFLLKWWTQRKKGWRCWALVSCLYLAVKGSVELNETTRVRVLLLEFKESINRFIWIARCWKTWLIVLTYRSDAV